jgi:hypothetical protein
MTADSPRSRGQRPQLRFPRLSILQHSIGKGARQPPLRPPGPVGGGDVPSCASSSHRCHGGSTPQRGCQWGRGPTANRRPGFTGPVAQELDFLREGALTGAAPRSGQCRGPALMGKKPRRATCALPMASAMAEASPSTSFYHLLGLGRARQLWMEPSLTPVRPASRAKRGGLEGRPGPFGGFAPSFASPDYRCGGTPWAGDWQRGAAAPFETSQRGHSPTVNRRTGFTGPDPQRID